MAGWIKLHRKFLKWEWYDDINASRVFLHMLLTANYEDKNWHGLIIKRGQLVMGSLAFSKEVGLTRQVLRTTLDRLKSTNEITSTSTNKFTIITIVKYEDYQGKDEEDNQQDNQQINQQLTNKQPTTNQQITTTKESNKKRNQEIKDRDFLNKGSDFDVDKFLSDIDRMCCKSEAPGWDLDALIVIFNAYVKRNEIPKNPSAAFLAWVIKFTKGKSP